MKEEIIKLIKEDAEFCMWILVAVQRAQTLRVLEQIKVQQHEEGLDR